MSVAIQSLPSSSRDAAGLAARLGVPFHEIAIHAFPDGEIRVTVGPASATTIIYASLDRPNDKLIALMFAAEALRRGGAKRLVLVAPYLCYMRQDTAFHEGEAISQKVIGPLLARCVDRVVTVDAHLHRTPDIMAVFPGIQSDNLSAMPAISDTLRKAGLDPATVVVGTGCGIPALGQRPRRPARPVLYRCEKDPPRGSLGRDRISGQDVHRRPPRPDRRRHRLVRRHHHRLRQGADRRRRDGGRRRRDTCPVSGSGSATRWSLRGFARSVRRRAYRTSPMPLCSMNCSPMP